MTLIVGTPHWNGVCINTDTRVTNKETGQYSDNAQKFFHVHGGIGMAASGHVGVSTYIYEQLKYNLAKTPKHGGNLLPNEDAVPFIQALIYKTLLDLPKNKNIQKMQPKNVISKGLVGFNTDQTLTFNSSEAQNILEIIGDTEIETGLDINNLRNCANGYTPEIKLHGYNKSVLYAYEVDLGSSDSTQWFKVNLIPFGQIKAFGSGSYFDYEHYSTNILRDVLFKEGRYSIDAATMHLSKMQGIAQWEVPADETLKFKTFGGSIIAGIIKTDSNGMGSTSIVLGDFGSKLENRIISKTFKRNGKLWVYTKENKKYELTPFPSLNNSTLYI